MTAETPAGTRTAPAPGKTANKNGAHQTAAKKIAKKTWSSPVFWSSLRACLFLAAAIVFFVIGYPLKPGSAPQLQPLEPTVTIVTNDPQHFAGSVSMSLFTSGRQQQLYNLQLTITPSHPVPQGTTVEVTFGKVPRPIPSLKPGIVSSAQTGTEYYEFLSLPPTGTQMYTGTYTSKQEIGEIAKGGQLRVAFPTFAGETPGSQYTGPACGTRGTLAGQPAAVICSSLGSGAAQAEWSVPTLHAGQSTLASGDPGLEGYQYLAGDPPTLLNGSGWTWTGINGATVLAANVITEGTQQNDVFYSGIFLGVAAAAAIAFVTELLRPVWRKDPA
jgi:hypothetical protein